MKFNDAEIINAFMSPKPKKTTYGNFRIEGNRLIYRAQSSEEVRPGHWNNAKDFKEFQKHVAEMIRERDGKLTQGGKTILLEGLTENSDSGDFRVSYYETNLVAQKVKVGAEFMYLGNSDTLDLIGRTISYGNENRNSGWTGIQSEMRARGFRMLPLKDFEGENFETFKCLESGPETKVKVTVNQGARWYNRKEVESVISFQATLFQLEGKTYLHDVDRADLKAGCTNEFLTRVEDVSTIDTAYESMKPQSVLDVESAGLSVERVGPLFFVETDAPEIPELTTEEKLIILGAGAGYELSAEIVEYIVGHAVPRGSKQAAELLALVPKATELTAGKRTVDVETSITINGEIYCTGEVTRERGAGTVLRKWYTPIHRKGESHDNE